MDEVKVKEPWELSPYDLRRYMKHQRAFLRFELLSQDYRNPYWSLLALRELINMRDMLGGIEYKVHTDGHLRAYFIGMTLDAERNVRPKGRTVQ